MIRAVGAQCDEAEAVLERAGDTLIGGECTVSIARPIAAKAVSPSGCNTGAASTSRNLAIDHSDRLYVAFQCGTAGDGFVAVSADGGATTAMPVALGIYLVTRPARNASADASRCKEQPS